MLEIEVDHDRRLHVCAARSGSWTPTPSTTSGSALGELAAATPRLLIDLSDVPVHGLGRPRRPHRWHPPDRASPTARWRWPAAGPPSPACCTPPASTASCRCTETVDGAAAVLADGAADS